MCHACEMGEEPLTINDCRAIMQRIYRSRAEQFNHLIARLPLDVMAAVWCGSIMDNVRRELAAQQAMIEEIRQWTDDPDDTGWLSRQYEAAVREWNQADGEDQFWSLPAHVLDGP